jgi:hypothetical protein
MADQGTSFNNSNGDGIVYADGFAGPQGPAGSGVVGPAVFPNGANVQTIDGVTAHAGGGQTSAAAITDDYTHVTTTASANDSVILPASAAGMIRWIQNSGAQTLAVYPAVGETINGGSANADVTVATGHACCLICYTAGAWYGPVALA